jgi:voltage-gated sodium channel
MPRPPDAISCGEDAEDAYKQLTGSDEHSSYFSQILDAQLRFTEVLQRCCDEQAELKHSLQLQHDALVEKLDRIGSHSLVFSGSPTNAHLITGFNKDAASNSEANGVGSEGTECSLSPSYLRSSSSVGKTASLTGLSKKRAAPVRKKIHFNLGKHTVDGEDMEEAVHWLVVHMRSVIQSTQFELFMGAVIFLNMIAMAIHLEWKGYAAAYTLGLRANDAQFDNVEPAFDASEKIFNSIYLIELIMRIWAFRQRFFKQVFNIVDGLIVLGTCVVSFILDPLQSSSKVSFSSLRVMRAFRIFRILKVVRFAEYLGEMRVLVRTLMLSMRGLEWSIVLISGIILAGAILMVQLTFAFLDDQTISLERREWLFEMFGTTGRSVYTMFECTFTGGWRFYSRPCIFEVSLAFAVFWVLYIVCINFAVMRVIAALFLKQTMAVAAVDEERAAMMKLKERERFANELRQVFVEADESKDGSLSKEEFVAMMRNPNIVEHFEKLDLEPDEVTALYGVLSADDGEADYEEFLDGALKMKSSARTIDTVQIMHQQLRMQRCIEFIIARLGGGGLGKLFNRA